ncbi:MULTISPECIES: hypothetical protein [Streptomyces]|uniref:Uncharacterized protein n=1 Tax=Streptomyces stelliscabiei TaxID=146820 RepID=A0A8I0TTF3_9ACTN|nr:MULTISPECIES: hypothetical protein [Streptomyces]MBE1599632.1 hypothetical protein [Streptomyces stelliscabiei]MDX2519646.1 hypothetical protein [Streptomyces stelliscabiei]MDX2553795.1 hypothetical protein [Streptomyces stelliscabiei]MDX2612538.1 hypothetical protein [Streptomyces stelliscabiei]MDX2638418.1 hypothetical protein [Streptomyces stelliscabiei]
MIRRPVAVVTAFVLFVEGLGIAGLQWFLGTVVDRQKMSLAGLDPDAMSLSTKAGGVVFGLYFVLCGVVALLVGVRNRPAAGLGRILLISVAVVHGLLGALTVGLVGWGAFAFMMVVLGLVLLTLMTYDRQDGSADAVSGGAGGADGPGEAKESGGVGGAGGSEPVAPAAPSAS